MRGDVLAKIAHWICTSSFRYFVRFFLSFAITSASVSPSMNSRRIAHLPLMTQTSRIFATGRPVSAARASFIASFRIADTL